MAGGHSSRQVRGAWPAHEGEVRCVSFVADAGLVGTSGDDGWLKLWSLREGAESKVAGPGVGSSEAEGSFSAHLLGRWALQSAVGPFSAACLFCPPDAHKSAERELLVLGGAGPRGKRSSCASAGCWSRTSRGAWTRPSP